MGREEPRNAIVCNICSSAISLLCARCDPIPHGRSAAFGKHGQELCAFGEGDVGKMFGNTFAIFATFYVVVGRGALSPEYMPLRLVKKRELL